MIETNEEAAGNQMNGEPDPIQAAAEFMAVELHSQDRKAAYSWNVRAKACADTLFYLLQALSFALTSVCFGLVTNYLYDIAKEKLGRKPTSVETSLSEYQEQIDKLRRHLAKLQSSRKSQSAREWLRFHELTMLRVQERDPQIIALAAKAIEQLEQRAAASLEAEVSRHAELPS